MKTKDFDYEKWLSVRSAKESTKTVDFSSLTKAEKLSTLFNLLDKTEDDFKDVQIASGEQRMFRDLSAPAKLFVLNERNKEAQNFLRIGDTVKALEFLTLPKATDLCEVTVNTGFLAASMNAQIEYLTKLYNKPIDVITIDLPCGENWVKGLIEYCKGLEITEK